MLQCPFATFVWGPDAQNIQTWLMALCTRYDKEQRRRVFMVAWELWRNRNQIVWLDGRRSTAWPPMGNVLKVNVDVAWVGDSVRTGLGWILRDRQCFCLGGVMCGVNSVAELLGIREALSWLKNVFSSREVVVEND
ncbi:hypothetical protein JCGZ_05899 [Jatropha curcas]|uniref:RNase H type-1 domain-containing protein n=1 Tax=Jatropha curcas TaxID=180498 RepID=A0A067JJH6_JATCU|nr:hypothetical protein JCGZ_05899 [Jatropha curcas]